MESEYKTSKNSFLYCPTCGEIMEREIDFPLFDGSGRTEKRKVSCMCRCQREKKEAIEKRFEFEEEQRRIDQLKQLSLMDARLKEACFENYQVTEENKKIFHIAKRYVENFEKMFSIGQGLLFWGNVGTGKSYTAATIANELLNQRKSVIMTSFIKLLDMMSRFEEDSDYIARLNQARLLIVDDLGAERGTDFSLERVYDIIDSRSRSKKPIILTTNLEISQMKSCEDIRYNRIYDRIFEMCYPVKVEGMSLRKREAAIRFPEIREILEN